jgi:hypothetical protein
VSGRVGETSSGRMIVGVDHEAGIHPVNVSNP